MTRGWRDTRAIACALLCIAVGSPLQAVAQSRGGAPVRAGANSTPASRWEFGAAGSLLIDYPTDVADPYCKQTSGGVSAYASNWLRSGLGVEASLTATGGLGREVCYLALYAPGRPGEPYDRNRWEDDDFGAGTIATTLAAVLEPWRGGAVSPRARAGAGVMLDQPLGLWFYGGGVRYGFGRHSMTMDVERWNTRIAVLSETVVLPVDGPLQVLSSRRVTSTYGMFLIRVGWAVAR